MKNFILLYLLISFSSCYSQENSSQKTIDSLKTAIVSQKGLEKIKTLSEIDHEYFQSGNFPLFLKNHTELKKELLKCKGNCDYYWLRFYDLSVLYYNTKDDYKNSFFLLQKIIDFNTNDKRALNVKAKAFRRIIGSLRTLEQYDEAEQYASQAEKFISRNSIDDIFVSGVYLELGNMNFALHKNAELTKSNYKQYYFNKSKEYYKKAYDIIKSISFPPKNKFDNNSYYESLYLLAPALYNIGNKENAEIIFKKFDSLQEKKAITHRTYLFAKGFEFDTKSKESIITNPEVLVKNIDKVIALNDKTKFRNQNTHFLSFKARVLKKTKRFTLAEKEYRKAYQKLENIGDDNIIKIEVTEALGEIYEILGQEQKAIFFKNKTIELAQYFTKEKSPFSMQKAEIIILLEKKRQQRELALEKLETQKAQSYFIITLMSLVIILFITAALFLFNRNLKIKQKLLISEVNYNKEIALNSELENIYQIKMELSNQKTTRENKQKIAKNLHDDLASSLAATHFMIMDKANNADTEKDKNNFLDIKEEINSLYENVRKYIHNLHKDEETSNFSITEYLFNLIKKNEVLSDLKFVVDADFNMMDEKLSIIQKNQLYRIIKESVTNSLKYAEARKIEITIKINGQFCIFSVKDNGKGIFISQKTGLGIANMKERIAKLGGTLTIQSNKENGTIISSHFPLL